MTDSLNGCHLDNFMTELGKVKNPVKFTIFNNPYRGKLRNFYINLRHTIEKRLTSCGIQHLLKKTIKSISSIITHSKLPNAMRQRLLFIWLALLLGVAGANAKEAYAYYMESDHSLNFCYDDSKASRSQSYPVYSLNINSYDPEWLSIADKIEELYFYSSFADYRPTSCYRWAFQMTNLTRVRNIQYLNTSNVTNMEDMFCYCYSLTTLNLM